MTTHNIFTLSDSTATRVSPPATHSGVDITIQNINASGDIYIGSQSVDVENYGYKILPNHAISFELPSKDELYAVSSINSLLAAVIITGLEGNE